MVTHDVDEALFLSDRIVMMTSGPEAHVGEILTVPFPRPRNRHDVTEHPDYYVLRERLIAFLEEQGHGKAAPPPQSAPQPRGLMGFLRGLVPSAAMRT
jgi:ABC-type nitrate/sulfonate/bicarbonate transport system ATPase subunit